MFRSLINQAHSRLTVSIYSAFVILGFCAPAFGQTPSMPKGAKKCVGIHAYANDYDYVGVNVRIAPDSKAPVIGTLKRRVFAKDAYDRPFSQAPFFDVVASYRGWLLIQGYAYPDSETEPPLPVFPGWVHGSQVRVESFGDRQKTYLYRRKNGVGRIGQINTGIGQMEFALLGCDGSWAEVQQRLLIQAENKEAWGIRAWIAGQDLCVEQPNRRRVVNICVARH
jgi:hypothetical protein